MSQSPTYVIRGGISGRERLRILARVMAPTTGQLLDRLGSLAGARCLDAGCGGGDVTRELARRAGPGGHVVGVDLDDEKLAICREESAGQGHMEFRSARIGEDPINGPFDVVFSRFLLTHLVDPGKAVDQFLGLLRPGGRIAIEDIDFSGYVADPFSDAQRRYAELYSAVVRKRGADPDIGPKLPLLLKKHGFVEIEVSVVQPLSLSGEAKLITPITTESITDAVVNAGLATSDDMAALANQLFAEAGDPATLSGMPRVVQVLAKKP